MDRETWRAAPGATMTDWQRRRANPIIRPGKDQWDRDAVNKPYAIYDGKQWLFWCNGRKGGVSK